MGAVFIKPNWGLTEERVRQLTTKMLKQLVLILVVVSVSLGQKISKKSYTGTKAASPFTNYGCQCSNLQFVAKGYRQGNCASADETGALWCYVDNNHNSCQDKRRSDRYHNRAWSYEACATPSIYGGNYQNQPVCKGSRCGGYGTGSNFGNNGGYGTGSNLEIMEDMAPVVTLEIMEDMAVTLGDVP